MKSTKSSFKIPEYLVTPRHPITVLVVGAGGTGSEMVNKLARISHALCALNKQSLHVTLIDHDEVTPANMARQLFSESDIGRPKNDVLIERINRFYGNDWISSTGDIRDYTPRNGFNIIISCTDNIASRKSIRTIFNKTHNAYNNPENTSHLWIDTGNDFDTGNITISDTSKKMPDIFTIYGDIPESENVPSCSLAEAIGKQHLFINTFVADVTASFIFDILTKDSIDYCGAFINLKTLRISKIPIGYYDTRLSDKNNNKKKGVARGRKRVQQAVHK